MKRRVESEGVQFLTVTLPRLGKAVDTALSSGTQLSTPGFQKKPGTQLPKLFGWLLELLFDKNGFERTDSSPEALRSLRQLVYFLYKLELTYDERKTQKVIADFIQTEKDLENFEVPDNRVTEYARRFTTDVFGLFDARDIVPRHGPGAVATGEGPAEKQVFSRIYDQIEAFYPFTEYFCLNLTHVADTCHTFGDLESLRAGTAKVVLVPKDSRGPRLISCEPLEYQWVQQGLGRKVTSHLESHRLTRRHVNFTDQQINRDLALQSSKDQEWVTLDMKEASDRVSTALVKELFRDAPVLLEALLATRSPETMLPDGTKVQLNKFAPMGSCLCFPVEAFVFYALAVGVLVHERRIPRREARKRVYVYGDDIIVRREDYAFLLHHFPEFGLMFNTQKCCTAGFFRESCGCDAYKGVDVTPIKLRSVSCHRRRLDIGVIRSYVALSNAAYKAGYLRLAKRTEDLVLQRTGPLPIFSHEDIGGIGFVRADACTHVQPEGVRTRFNKSLHRREVNTWQSVPEYEYSDADDWSTVLRRMTAPNQYTRPGIYAIPRRSRPKRGWTPIYQ
jgi:hypothetical protein